MKTEDGIWLPISPPPCTIQLQSGDALNMAATTTTAHLTGATIRYRCPYLTRYCPFECPGP